MRQTSYDDVARAYLDSYAKKYFAVGFKAKVNLLRGESWDQLLQLSQFFLPLEFCHWSLRSGRYCVAYSKNCTVKCSNAIMVRKQGRTCST